MDNHFVRITDIRAFEELLSRSKERPVVIFKHSTTCPISASAYQQMARFEGEVALVEIQRARELSREIEDRGRDRAAGDHAGGRCWTADHLGG